ncbi:MAG: GspE/PulE family protein [Pirellulales bacterium]
MADGPQWCPWAGRVAAEKELKVTMIGQTANSNLDRSRLAAISQALQSQVSLDDIALEHGFASSDELLMALAETLDLDLVNLDELEVEPELVTEFPAKLIHRHEIFPLSQQGGQLRLAVSNPFDFHALDAVSAALRVGIQPVLARPEQLKKLIKATLGVGAETLDGLLALQRDEVDPELLKSLDGQDLEEAAQAQEASVVRLVNEILGEGIEARASDIHVEAQEQGLKLRYRIDGVLQRQPTAPEMNRFRSAIVSRLKIMAKLNIAEKRIPQDGRIKLRLKGREVDIRVSIIPMLHGESVVMRILDKENLKFSLQSLGMPWNVHTRFQQLIRLPHGIVLVTGPTGSGKTTTLYSALAEIRSEDTKIITTEDPIEYQLEGINQIQVHQKVGLTFAACLRSILRHDPDVVLVGEIRDFETAESAIQASLTGHLVFSTLHTNDAASAFLRLCDMGVEPFLVSSTVEGVMAQRLVRRLCPECRRGVPLDSIQLPDDFPWSTLPAGTVSAGTVPEVFEAVGCPQCRGTGYRGRVGIYELLTTNDEIRHLAAHRAPTQDVRKAACQAGMQTLRQDAWAKLLEGVTTVDEVLRVTKPD